ncbi:hypothetical protein PM082_013328 [Marasmius tenuissimus]|nr:hypothetical protein PM082_013328 [Marasmius tenuissimus]
MSRRVFSRLQSTVFRFVFSLPLFGEIFGFGGSLIDLQLEETLPSELCNASRRFQNSTGWLLLLGLSPESSERKAARIQ